MTAKTAAVLTGTLVLAAFGAGWVLNPQSADDASTRRAPTSETDRVARARYDAALRENEALKARADDLRRKLEALPAGAEAAPAADEAAAQAAAQDAEVQARLRAPRYRYAGMEAALDDVDWKIVGEALRNIAPLLGKMGDSIEETGNPVMSDLGEIQRWNGPLVVALMKLVSHEVPGLGAPGVLTNPGVVSNMLFAALEGTDTPMSADQQKALHELTLAALEEDRQRNADNRPERLGIENFIAEMELKQRYYDRVDEILSDAQRATVHPKKANGNTGVDLLSSGIALRFQVIPLHGANKEELQQKFVDVHMSHLKLAEEARPVLQRLAADWAAGLEGELPKGPSPLIRQMFYYPLEHTLSSAYSYVPARKAMLAQLPLTDEQRKRLTMDAHFVVPFTTP